MDALLQTILLLIGFAALVFIISRSVRGLMVAGIVAIAVIALRYFGVLD